MILFFTVSYHAVEKTLTGKVMKVSDGETVVINPVKDRALFVCRLYGIDAPEKPKYTRKGRLKKLGQPYGEEATTALKKMIMGQTVQVTLTGAKTCKKEVCRIENDGMDVNLEMVRLGYAWAYRQHLQRPYDWYYIGAERDAREQRLGPWQDSIPTPPWEYRRSLRQK
jgi:micrococcal nuclease